MKKAAWMLIALISLLPESANAIFCIMRVAPLSFGMYMPGQTTPLDAVGRVDTLCFGSPGSYSISIGPGQSGDQLARLLQAGPGQTLGYTVYRDAAYTQIWGNGVPPTFVVSGSRPSRGWPTFRSHPLYGRILPNQFPDPGSYTDNLLVTVLF